jgi:Uma2 family endonuclease
LLTVDAYAALGENDRYRSELQEGNLVVEIVSPGSHRTDHVIKRGEYADAGIPHY